MLWIIWTKCFSSAPSKFTKYFNYKSRFNCIFSRYNLPRRNDGVYIINLNDQESKVTHWFFLFINRNTSVHFDSFGIEYISQEVLNKIEDKSITKNIFRIKCNDCTMCGFYCIAFIEYLIAGKTLLEYANLFSPNNYQKNDKIIYKYFKTNMSKEKVNLDFRLEEIHETRNYLLEEVKHNNLMSGKYKQVCRALN